MAHAHVLSVRLYLGIFAALLVLTGLTTAVAFVDLGGGRLNFLNLLAAIAIAGAKSILVVLFFMHLKYSNRLTWIVGGGVLLWLLLILGFTAADYLSRQWIPVLPPWTS
jgi:cytochrome c oxidase subunit 4